MVKQYAFQMWICIACPFLIFPLIKYRQDDRLQLSDGEKAEPEDLTEVSKHNLHVEDLNRIIVHKLGIKTRMSNTPVRFVT